jgi:tRNA (mo5U34)-methyltransferase
METLAERIAAIPYWYHRIELPDGTVTPGWSPIDPERYCIPEDLTGKRVLDIGAWDGYWTWEALKRGASEVVAIDDFSDDCGLDKERTGWDAFDLCREAFGFAIGPNEFPQFYNKNETGQKVTRIELSVYDIGTRVIGKFDVVFFFGTFYHLKHPLLALEAISKVSSGSIYIETASLDEASPYRGGIGKGYDQNDMVMEFYPTDEYAKNKSNWWVPTLQCLGGMLHSVGYKDIEAWPLTEKPTSLAECRGFLSATKDSENNPANHPKEVKEQVVYTQQKVAAVMSVPRLGFQDNMECATAALWPLRIPMINVQGAFWGQCLERGIQLLIDDNADIVITIDYDTVFKRQDVEGLIKLMYEHPEAGAIIPIQSGRASNKILTSMKGKSGAVRQAVPLTEFKESEVTKVATGHFGLTALRVKDLMDIEHPWFHSQPNSDNQWGPGRIDADIWFWKLFEKAGKTAYLANRIVVGHLELMCTWPDETLQPIYQVPGDFHTVGKPKEIWK